VSEKSAKTLVLVAAGLLAFYALQLRQRLGVAAQAGSAESKARYLVQVALLTLGLTVLADISPEVAGPFAVLVVVFVYGRYLDQVRSSHLSAGASASGNRLIAPATGG
jgi:hypothetical protein